MMTVSGKPARAIPVYSRMAELQREEVDLHPGVVPYRFDLAMTMFHLTQPDHLVLGQPQDALRHAQEGIERLDAGLAADKDPQGESKSLLGMLWERRAEALVAVLGRPTEAIAALESACGHRREAVERDPRSIDYKAQLFRHHYYLVALHCVLGRTGEARKRASKPRSRCGPPIRGRSSLMCGTWCTAGRRPPLPMARQPKQPVRRLSYTRPWS